MVIYVDVDDTLVRSFGSKRIPIPATIAHVKTLKAEGVEMYCWSSGGGAYAESSSKELGIEDCFLGFLPKPTILIDDFWRKPRVVHPNEACGMKREDYFELSR